jgi:hypothetical protein
VLDRPPSQRAVATPKVDDEHRQTTIVRAPEIDPPLTEMLKLIREQCAHNHRLEQQLSARDRELARLLAETKVFSARSKIEKTADNEDENPSNSGFEVPNHMESDETFGSKFMAFVNTRSDAQTESG